MRDGATVSVIIPVLDEEAAIGRVLAAIPDWVDEILVVDNGSKDATPFVARRGGARVIFEPRRGYGSACLAGIRSLGCCDVVVFLDGDFSDHPEEMPLLVDPIIAGKADMVIGSRVTGKREHGALTPQALFGNWLACRLMRFFWGMGCTDLGPFRAIGRDALKRLGMSDPDFGWTVEMQVRGAAMGLRIIERPVSYRKRIGRSKISGTVRGVLSAGTKILWTIVGSAAGIRFPPCIEGWPERLMIFTRYPEPGKTKTRLIPALGPEEAARLQQRMTEDTLTRAMELTSTRALALEIRFDGGNLALMSRWLGPDREYVSQGDGDLGAKLERAFEESFRRGAQRVAAIGVDCPHLTPAFMERAFESLKTRDLVLGPASDGGYYLIGLGRHCPPLFRGIDWGSDSVFESTVRIAEEFGLSMDFLEVLHDVDRPADLALLRSNRSPEETGDSDVSLVRASSIGTTTISVIVPALDEAESISRTLEPVTGLPGVEVIVADGGSSDNTRNIARSLGARVISSQRGRASQLNNGAAAATGKILLFLHADTRLPQGWSALVREIISRGEALWGAFLFKLDETFPLSRIIERLANLRTRLFHMPYGDQAVFIDAGLFHKVGGFPDIPVMEDFEFARLLRRECPLALAPLPAVTSSRRWKQLGVLRATTINQAIILAHLAGMGPNKVAGLYRVGRDR